MTVANFDRLLARYQADLEAAFRREAALVADVAAHGGVVPADYWKERQLAQTRLRAAVAVRAAFEEVSA